MTGQWCRELLRVVALVACRVTLVACAFVRPTRATEAKMDARTESELLSILRRLEDAANQADPSIAESVLWLDDERFSEIRDFCCAHGSRWRPVDP